MTERQRAQAEQEEEDLYLQQLASEALEAEHHDDEQVQVRQYEAIAHIPDDEEPF